MTLENELLYIPNAWNHPPNTMIFNHLTPNGHFSGRTPPLTYRCCIFYLFNKYMYWIF
jgi:hypothetical protein